MQKPSILTNNKIVAELGEAGEFARTVVRGLLPLARTLRRHGIQFAELVEAVREGDSLKEAVAAFVAGTELHQAIGGDATSVRRQCAAYLREQRRRARRAADAQQAPSPVVPIFDVEDEPEPAAPVVDDEDTGPIFGQ